MFSIEGKVVLLTGALGGIGRSFVKELLRNGAKGIALWDISEKLAETFEKEVANEFGDGKTIFVRVDLSDVTQIDDAYEKSVQHFKQLDIVINNAGVMEIDYLKSLQTNFVATAYITHLAFRKYLEKYRIGEEGVVINISSIAGLYPFGYIPSYGPSKQGVVALGRCFGDESHYNRRKIRIMTICPGSTDTSIIDQMPNFPDDLQEGAKKILETFKPQRTENVANAMIELIRNGKSGTTWVVKDDKPAVEVDFTEIDKTLYGYIS